LPFFVLLPLLPCYSSISPTLALTFSNYLLSLLFYPFIFYRSYSTLLPLLLPPPPISLLPLLVQSFWTLLLYPLYLLPLFALSPSFSPHFSTPLSATLPPPPLLQPLPFLWGYLQPFHSYSAPNLPQLFLIVMDAFICRKDIPDSSIGHLHVTSLVLPTSPSSSLVSMYKHGYTLDVFLHA
jgi:hypothetical protein